MAHEGDGLGGVHAGFVARVGGAAEEMACFGMLEMQQKRQAMAGIGVGQGRGVIMVAGQSVFRNRRGGHRWGQYSTYFV